MKREELVNSYENLDIEGKWELIKRAVGQDVTEVCPLDTHEFSCFAKEQKTKAIRDRRYLKLFWHYWLRKVPLLAPAIGQRFLPLKDKEYYQYRTWYYEYLEPVIDIRNHFSDHEKVFELLADEKSKGIYCDILMARITKSDEYYQKGYDKSKEYQQYFALDILPLPNPEGVFVDCGGYIGDTVEKFIKYYSKKYKKIYIYEPDPQNAFQAKETLKDFHNISIKKCGIGRKNGTAFFNSMGTSSSSIQKKGAEVKVVSLDADIEIPITFIKMDIEGEESNGIAGAEKHIRNERPVCAICLYHKIEDIWRLPLQVIKINSDYKLYLRHYTENYMETVAYFI